jgi:hypothetical protein
LLFSAGTEAGALFDIVNIAPLKDRLSATEKKP